MRHISLFLLLIFFWGCGSSAPQQSKNPIPDDGSKYALTYKGLRFYAKSLPSSAYSLSQIDDKTFNALSKEKQLQLANKLLSTLFFGYPQDQLKTKIESGSFISSLQAQLKATQNNKEEIEAYLQNKDFFFHASYTNDEVIDILARFYAMEHLDDYYVDNWVAYILTQTIMFSPAYELESSHEPNTARVYNAMVRNLQDDASISYSTYLHMISSDNWRRFRSPEDNGREMMEIYALMFDDTKVPIAGKALQNWKLDRDNDTLVIGLHDNTQALSLFGTTIYNGDDFYRELAKSNAFQSGITRRLVDFFFTNNTDTQKAKFTKDIVLSNPQNWRDVLVQIVFSKAYLLESARAKSAEESFYGLIKKIDYKHFKYSFTDFQSALDSMHQASMKYKLGKLTRVPLDTLSFINYHKFIREKVLLRAVKADKLNDYKSYNAYGWKPSFIDDGKFNLSSNPKDTLDGLINYLFETLLSREPDAKEIALFENHILEMQEGKLDYVSGFDLQKPSNRANATILILEYISRLSELYTFKKVVS